MSEAMIGIEVQIPGSMYPMIIPASLIALDPSYLDRFIDIPAVTVQYLTKTVASAPAGNVDDVALQMDNIDVVLDSDEGETESAEGRTRPWTAIPRYVLLPKFLDRHCVWKL